MTYITNPGSQTYGEFYWDDNGTATTIGTADTPIAVISTTTGSVSGWTYSAGVHGTDISAYATSDAGARTKVTTTGAHGLSLGDYITISGTTNYNDVYEVMEIVDVNNFTIDKAWDTNDDAQGNYDRGCRIVADTGSSGLYSLEYSMAMSEGGAAGSVVDLVVYVNKTAQGKSKMRRKFSNNDVGAAASSELVTISDGDHVWMSMQSSGTNAITVSNGSIQVTRI